MPQWVIRINIKYEVMCHEVTSVSELQRIVNMDRIPNIFVFENLTNTEYRIIGFLKIDQILNMNSTIWTQLFEYQILNNEY